MSLQEIAERHRGNAATVLQYAITTKEIVDGAKAPGFSVQSWNPLREFQGAGILRPELEPAA